MSKQMKTYLFVDGTNLYASQYELFGPKKYLNFSKFTKEVEKKNKGEIQQDILLCFLLTKAKKTNQETETIFKKRSPVL